MQNCDNLLIDDLFYTLHTTIILTFMLSLIRIEPSKEGTVSNKVPSNAFSKAICIKLYIPYGDLLIEVYLDGSIL